MSIMINQYKYCDE